MIRHFDRFFKCRHWSFFYINRREHRWITFNFFNIFWHFQFQGFFLVCWTISFIFVWKIKKKFQEFICVWCLYYMYILPIYVKVFRVTHLIRIELHTSGNTSSGFSPVTHIEVVIGKIETKQKNILLVCWKWQNATHQ